MTTNFFKINVTLVMMSGMRQEEGCHIRQA